MLGRVSTGFLLSYFILGSALAAEESYSDASCKKASGQSQSLMKAVAERALVYP
jgi:hypothetical protein